MTKRKDSHSKSWQVSGKKPKIKAAEKESEPSVDENGHFVCRSGNIIDSYNIETVLGEGAYGRVVRVKHMDTLRTKALKIFKNDDIYVQAAYREIYALKLIAAKDPNDTSLCIKILDWFTYHNHACIVFDAFGMSVFDFMKVNNYKPYSMEDSRHIAYQLCQAVKFLHGIGLTHTDIKPENLLLVDSSTLGDSSLKSTEIRLIDFGGATADGFPHSSLITTRYYRAPEVVLKLGWTQACDIWSIGCTIFELCFADMLFPTGDDDLEHLGMMEEILGPVPHAMTSRCEEEFFIDGKLNYNENFDDAFIDVCDKVKQWFNRSETSGLGKLLKYMLAYDSTERITVEEALNHPFFENMPPSL